MQASCKCGTVSHHPENLEIIRVGPGKKNYNPWKNNFTVSPPLTPGKKIIPWKRNLSTQPEPGWRGVGGEGAAPPPQMHSQNMLRDSLAVHRLFGAVGPVLLPLLLLLLLLLRTTTTYYYYVLLLRTTTTTTYYYVLLLLLLRTTTTTTTTTTYYYYYYYYHQPIVLPGVVIFFPSHLSLSRERFFFQYHPVSEAFPE